MHKELMRMTTKNRIRLIRLSEKIEKDSELKKCISIEVLRKNEKNSKNLEKPLERSDAVWQTIDVGGK
jgi:hypothetical protein